MVGLFLRSALARESQFTGISHNQPCHDGEAPEARPSEGEREGRREGEICTVPALASDATARDRNTWRM
jgi:hypothetical protein